MNKRKGRILVLMVCVVMFATIFAVAVPMNVSANPGSEFSPDAGSLVRFDGNGHYYKVFYTRLNWHEACDYCTGLDGHLVTISSLEENLFVYEMLPLDVLNDTWLGASDEVSEGTWQWVTGEPWEFEYWAPGEPSNCCPTPENYLIFWGDPGGAYYAEWNDVTNFELCFVCEWDTIQDIPKGILAAGYEKNWSAEFVYDIPIGTFTEGTYSYCIEVEWTEPTPGGFVSGWQEFEISEDAPLYEGFVVIRWFEIWARVRDENGLRCEIIDPIFHPDQPMRFHTGWAIDEEMTRSEAKAHFESLTEKFVFDDGSFFELERSSTIWSELPDVMWEKRKCSWTMRQ